MFQRRKILFSTRGSKEGFAEKVVFELSLGEREGFGKVERSRGGHSGKGNGMNEGPDIWKYRRI